MFKLQFIILREINFLKFYKVIVIKKYNFCHSNLGDSFNVGYKKEDTPSQYDVASSLHRRNNVPEPSVYSEIIIARETEILYGQGK